GRDREEALVEDRPARRVADHLAEALLAAQLLVEELLDAREADELALLVEAHEAEEVRRERAVRILAPVLVLERDAADLRLRERVGTLRLHAPLDPDEATRLALLVREALEEGGLLRPVVPERLRDRARRRREVLRRGL